MTTVKIQNLLCYKDETFDLDLGVTLITGKNATGKTSLARILAALVSGNGNPAGLDATQKKAYVLDGAHEGQAEMKEVIWRPGSGEITAPKTMTDYPWAPQEAVGLIDFTRPTKPKQKAELWESLFLPSDVRELLEPEWAKKVKPSADINDVVSLIETSGWDVAAETYVRKRADAKMSWQVASGVGTYGASKAVSWVPAGWDADLESESKQSLEAALVAARDVLQDLTTAEAVDQAGIDRAKEIRDTEYAEASRDYEECKRIYPGLNVTLEEEKAVFEKFKTQDEESSRVRDETGEFIKECNVILESRPPHVCPHCGNGVTAMITKWEPPTPQKEKEAKDAIHSAIDKIAAIDLGAQHRTQSIDDQEKKVRNARVAAKANNDKGLQLKGQLATLLPKIALADSKPAEGANEGERQKAEGLVERAKTRLAAWKQYNEAWMAHQNVVEYDEMCSILGPQGVRSTVLDNQLKGLNAKLNGVCKVAGWQPITLTSGYDLLMAGRPVALTSESDKLKVQWALQSVFTHILKSRWLILDRGDTVKDESWDGLCEFVTKFAVSHKDLHVVLCATSAKARDGWRSVTLTA